MIIYTMGHSNRSIEDFLEILKEYKITKVADVRSVPKSRHNPQYNQDEIKQTLRKNGVKYEYFKGLGGFRPLAKNDINAGWENKSFKGYADYMQTDEFLENLDKLIQAAKKDTIVVMCAEVLPWRCHRSLIGDALTVRGYCVEDIISLKSCKVHELTSFAKVDGLNITYPLHKN